MTAPEPAQIVCPNCGGKGTWRRSWNERVWRGHWNAHGHVYDIFQRYVDEQCPRCKGEGCVAALENAA